MDPLLPGARPETGVETAVAQHPAANRHHQAHVLGNRDALVGLVQLASGDMPAQQRFGADDPPAVASIVCWQYRLACPRNSDCGSVDRWQ